MQTMTLKQFEVIAKLLRSKEPVKTAARLVLVEGMSNAEAAREARVSPQSCSNSVVRYQAADMEIKLAYKAVIKPRKRA